MLLKEGLRGFFSIITSKGYIKARRRFDGLNPAASQLIPEQILLLGAVQGDCADKACTGDFDIAGHGVRPNGFEPSGWEKLRSL
jgi:hypothetical protein